MMLPHQHIPFSETHTNIPPFKNKHAFNLLACTSLAWAELTKNNLLDWPWTCCMPKNQPRVQHQKSCSHLPTSNTMHASKQA